MNTTGTHDGIDDEESLLNYPYPLPGECDPYEDGYFALMLPSQNCGYERGTGGGVNKPGRRVPGNDFWRFDPLQNYTSQQYHPPYVGPWKYCVHEEGHPYYHLARGESRYFSYLTHLDPSKDDVELGWFIAWLEQAARDLHKETKVRFSINVEVVLEKKMQKGGDAAWCYYMADIDLQSVIFLHSIDVPHNRLPVLLSEQEEHIPIFFVVEYWIHVKNFPIHRAPSREKTDVLVALNAYRLDKPRTLDAILDVQDILEGFSILRDLAVEDSTRLWSGNLMYQIANVMLVLARERFGNVCRGVPNPPRTWLAKLMLLLLLFQPDHILQQIEEMFKDRFVSKQELTALQEKLEKESSTFVIYATVLLAVDISFLAVPSVAQDDLLADETTLTTLTGQLSMITCLGSIIIGFLHARQERIDRKDGDSWYASGWEVHEYLEHNSDLQFRLEILAVHLSLPLGLLQWGILAFVISVLTSCFDANFTVVGITERRWIYGAVCVIMASLVVWTIHTGVNMISSLLPRNNQHETDHLVLHRKPKPKPWTKSTVHHGVLRLSRGLKNWE